MNVLLCVKSTVIGEALHEILCKDDDCGICFVNDTDQDEPLSLPDVIITDRWCLSKDLLAKYPEAKMILMDSGMQQPVRFPYGRDNSLDDIPDFRKQFS